MLLSTVKHGIKRILPEPAWEALKSLRHEPVRRIPHDDVYIRHVAGKRGIEIGGPSKLFGTNLPLYRKIRSLDGVNFAHTTVWEGHIEAGRHYRYADGRTGTQYIADATDLAGIGDGVYDFLLSSNCLEHVANPIKALMAWRRVLKPGGVMILVLPNKAGNFDHDRPTTPFAHLLDDFANDTSERDLTHLDEILALHDLAMDPPAGDLDHFRRRSLDNFANRTLHHHVFDLDVMAAMFAFLDFDILQQDATHRDFFMLARKSG
jgi:SAM-dependent methyltransferase